MDKALQIVTIIQARTGSTRLPDKILLPLANAPLLYRMYQRVASSKLTGTIVIATTTDSNDDKVAELCKEYNLNCFRGHPTDLLDRHYKAALKFNADAVVKIPSDCPIIDKDIIDQVISFYTGNLSKYDYVSNLHPATYPDGNDVEIMSLNSLKDAWLNASRDLEREHTTPFLWENPDKFRIGNVTWESGLDYSMSHRFTIDYQEDYNFIKKVYDELYRINNNFTLEDILDLLKRNPDIEKINQKYCGVNWYRNHLNELQTIKSEQTKII